MNVDSFRNKARITSALSHELDTHLSLMKQLDDMFHMAFGNVEGVTTEEMEASLTRVRALNAMVAELASGMTTAERMVSLIEDIKHRIDQGYISGEVLNERINELLRDWREIKNGGEKC